MNKDEIVSELGKYIQQAKLPRDINFDIITDTLEVSVKSNAVVQNMQSDGSAFEGWIFMLRSFFKGIKKVKLTWETPKDGKGHLHYNRFLIRVLWFKENYDFLESDPKLQKELDDIKTKLSNLTINQPNADNASKDSIGSKKHEAILETEICEQLNKIEPDSAYHQLPVGLFDRQVKKVNGITPRGGSQIDIWQIMDKTIKVFELKDTVHTRNIKVGIISELMFYANVIYRLIGKKIKYDNPISNYRGVKKISDAIEKGLLNTVEGVFLTEELHPLIKRNISILLSDINNNKSGIVYKAMKPSELYKNHEKIKHIQLASTTNMFEGTPCGGIYIDKNKKNIPCQFILKDNTSVNIYSSFRKEVVNYFEENKIEWWKLNKGDANIPTGHLISSQVNCINHLFGIRKDPNAIINILNGVQEQYNVTDLVDSPIDKGHGGYISFEFVYKNKALLGDGYEYRGTKCTSVDAVIIVQTSDGKRIMFLIEWKYTEWYLLKKEYQNSIDRYSKLLQNNTLSNLKGWIPKYGSNPYYELARQTIFAEQIIAQNELSIDDYVHIMVVPEKNVLLWNDIKDEYIPTLKDQNKFILIDPQDFMKPIVSDKNYNDIIKYLKQRYWD